MTRTGVARAEKDKDQESMAYWLMKEECKAASRAEYYIQKDRKAR